MTSQLPAFIATTFLLAMLPGVGQALMLRQVLDGSTRTALASAAGTAAGLLIWSGAAATGVSALLLTSPGALHVVRGIGGGVLVLLGLRTLVSLQRRRRGQQDGQADQAPIRHASPRSGFLSGLAVNLGNPKAGIFAISLLPQFVDDNAHAFGATLGLGIVWGAVTFIWYLLFTLAALRGRTLLKTDTARRRLSYGSATVLVGAGMALAAGVV